MSLTYKVFVSLKIPDAVAATALNTIQRRLGYADIEKLYREEYWQFEFAEGNIKDNHKILKDIIENTSSIYNSNKHRYQLELPDGKSEGRSFLMDTDLFSCISILVKSIEDSHARIMLETLRKRFNLIDKLLCMERGMMWTLGLNKTSQRDINLAARDLSVTRDRIHGIFCNPNYQTYEILSLVTDRSLAAKLMSL